MLAPAPFWTLPLDQLDAGQWEALCDRCGKCCFHVGADGERSGDPCRLLDLSSRLCRDYPGRRAVMGAECGTVTTESIAHLSLPHTCAYRLRAHGEPLPADHHLVSAI